MQVLFGQVFKDDKDEQALVGGKPFTLRDAAKQALILTYGDEQNLPAEEKVKRYDLYLKVKEATDPAELTVEDVALVKKVIGKAYAVLTVGQAFRMLEGKTDDPVAVK